MVVTLLSLADLKSVLCQLKHFYRSIVDSSVSWSLFTGYRVSKIGVSRLTGLQGALAVSDPRQGILVNAVSI